MVSRYYIHFILDNNVNPFDSVSRQFIEQDSSVSIHDLGPKLTRSGC